MSRKVFGAKWKRGELMEQRVSVIALVVGDLDCSRKFHKDGLDWRRGNTGAMRSETVLADVALEAVQRSRGRAILTGRGGLELPTGRGR